MQNHLEISSKNRFWIRNVWNWAKTLTSDMSGAPKPVQEDSLSAKHVFFSLQKLHLSIFMIKFINFYKIICFIKQIYELSTKAYVFLAKRRKSLLFNQVSTFCKTYTFYFCCQYLLFYWKLFFSKTRVHWNCCLVGMFVSDIFGFKSKFIFLTWCKIVLNFSE